MECHLQIHLNHAWRDCAVVSISAGSARSVFEYDLDYAFGSVLEPVALRFPVNAERHQRAQWPAFLYDLVPQGKDATICSGNWDWLMGPVQISP
jgi:serine/threonine-protein kinase HipA